MKSNKGNHVAAAIAILLCSFSYFGLFLPSTEAAAPFRPPTSPAISTSLVISQVYGGGGNNMATYANDFIELFNRSSSPVTISGWSVQYASTSNNFSTQTGPLNATIPGGQTSKIVGNTFYPNCQTPSR